MSRLRSETGYVPHKARHQNGGDDEINVAGLSGVLADAQTPDSHASSHENGGADEVNVGGLSGVLADDQNAKSDDAHFLVSQAHTDLENEILTSDVSFPNLLFNGGFEEWSQGSAVAPTGWPGTGGSWSPDFARESTNIKEGTYSCKLTNNGGQTNQYANQTLARPVTYRGRKLTFAMWVKCSSANAAWIYLVDSAGNTASSAHTGGGGWELLTVTRTIDAAATYVQARLRITGNTNLAYFDAGRVIMGSAAPAYHPGALSRMYWRPDKTAVLSLSNQGDVSWTDLDLSSYLPAGATAVLVELSAKNNTSGEFTRFLIRPNGGGASVEVVSPEDAFHSTNYIENFVVCRVTPDRIIEYSITQGGSSTADVRIFIIGYFV